MSAHGMVLLVVILIYGIALALLLLFTSCAAPRYDAHGNGTRPGDRLERWAVHAVNGESY